MTRKVWRSAKFWLCALLFVGVAGQAFGLQAVIRIREDSYYSSYKAAKWPGASLTNFYAPLPVFFEGYHSTPRADIKEYTWNFGDGSPEFRGFNAAHVYERAGTFYPRLTVVDKYGATASVTATINVRQPDGITYYVDSAVGNDANTGKSPAEAWRTATKAFVGIAGSRYRPGDRILFRRGQTFVMEAGKITPGSFYQKYGYSFGAFGEGPKPVIQKVGDSTAPLIKDGTTGLAHFAIMDLEFRCTSPEGIPSGEVFAGTAEAFNLLFLRLDINNCERALGFSGDAGTRRIDGVFIVDCNIYDSNNTMIFARAHRFAMLNNTLDYGTDHLVYTSHMDRAVFAGNAFSRPAFGRVCLRVSANSTYSYPTNNICITDNHFEGWIDPKTVGAAHNGGGTRYNYVLMDIGPNVGSAQAINDVEFKNNTVKNAEMLLHLGVVDRLTIRDNVFDTVDSNPHAHRIRIGHTFEQRPCQNVEIFGNVITSNESRTRWPSVLGVLTYTGPAYNGITQHKNINFHDNHVWLKDSNGTSAIFVQNTAQIPQVHSDYNTYYTPNTAQMFVGGGSYWDGPPLSLSQWRTKTGNDLHSVVAGATMPKDLVGTPAPTDPSNPAPSDVALYRVNAGGSDYLDPDGNAWESDMAYVNTGGTYSTSQTIANTTLDPVYQSERNNKDTTSDLVYSFPVAAGSYRVRLHFAEIYGGAAKVGGRVFEVAVEDSTVLDNYDIFSDVGYLTAAVKECDVNVTDGVLNVKLVRQVQNPKVSAIEVLAATP